MHQQVEGDPALDEIDPEDVRSFVLIQMSDDRAQQEADICPDQLGEMADALRALADEIEALPLMAVH